MARPSYMAPEQWLGQPIDSRADIYSLGMMLFEMLTGRTPYVSETPFGLMHQHVYEPPPAASSLRDGLPAAVQPVLERALAKDRDQRFASAHALASAFKAAVAEPAAPTSVLVSDDEPTERVPIAIEKRAAADPPAQRTVVDIPVGTPTVGTPSRGRIGLPLLAALAAVAVISLVIVAVLSSRGPGNNPPVTQLLATGALAGPVWTMTPTPPTATLPAIVNPNPALPTTTPLPPTFTPLPSDTNTPVPTATPLPPTLTPLPSDTNTPVPSDTPEAPTLTPLPSDTPILTDTPEALTLTQSPLATGTVTLPFHEPIDTDIAAFCDQIGGAHPTFKTGTSIAVYWSWDAKTARLTQDHINNAFYTVQVDGQTLTGWEHRRTDIIQQADGHYYVYWFMPPLTGDLIAKGTHQIALKVTWKAPISDGDYNFGPGTSNEVGTGSCGYTIN